MHTIHLPFRLLLCTVLLGALTTCQPSDTAEDAPEARVIDWQGHRGARGLAPENSIPAFLLALEYPQVRTLELDVVISADSQIVVSHEPWLSADICSHPGGQPVTEAEAPDLNLYRMTYAEIQTYDCGSRGHPRFPEQRPIPTHKPTLAAVVEAVEDRSQDLERPAPHYNIEIKSKPEWDRSYTPPPATFVALVLAEIKQLGIADRANIQSFDPRILREVRQLDSTITLALLLDNAHSFRHNIDSLGFQPDIYSPHYALVSHELLNTIHAAHMQLIPWTVNDTATMRGLYELGVDGIITDYPNKIGAIQPVPEAQ
ncbi:MAG: glycerophosphodiester phosphodiesterase [Lewinella sp.]|nr:glycerophosphodiester phosphodiesterase [Lewinella sp.]